MKNIKLTVTLIVALALASCTINDGTVIEEPAPDASTHPLDSKESVVDHMDAGVLSNDGATAAADALVANADATLEAPQDAHAPLLIVYETTTLVTGAIGGRASADALCVQSVAGLSCPNGIHAFLSVSATDDIESMPENYGVPTTIAVKNAAGNWLGLTWSDLFQAFADGSIDTTANYYWSGSTAEGEVSSTCLGWTSTQAQGTIGEGGLEGADWVSASDSSCDVPRPLACLCY